MKKLIKKEELELSLERQMSFALVYKVLEDVFIRGSKIYKLWLKEKQLNFIYLTSFQLKPQFPQYLSD